MMNLRLPTLFAPLAMLAGLAVAADAPAADTTTTPIKHVIVVFQENISFDHYFATYPKAVNGPDESPFNAAPGTPSVNGLTDALLNHNPNKAALSGCRPSRPRPAIWITTTCQNNRLSMAA